MVIVTGALLAGWMAALGGTVLQKGIEAALEIEGDHFAKKARGISRRLLRLDEKEQQRHLELVLKNAIERGRQSFDALRERDTYREILQVLCEPGAHSEALRREMLQLFTLSETPNLARLNEIYNLSLRTRNLSKEDEMPAIDAAPYLTSFFNALIAELYADPYFKQQMSDVLQKRAGVQTQRSLTEITAELRRIGNCLLNEYTIDQFEHELSIYITYIERTLHHLKMVGFVPRERGEKKTDPELDHIFVPLRISPREILFRQEDEEMPGSLVGLLERQQCLVLLGGPGSGKSTAVRHLAWSHAAANQQALLDREVPLLTGQPVPLRIELRRFIEDRRHHPGYNFLTYVTEVQLGRDNISVRPQMFEELLERRMMLLLFDGLDEVATLNERHQLVEEIERFAARYPGNRLIVTSRPVGYELASFTSEWFSHAHVQNFNDEQIHQFLENWYTHVLRLFPLPHEDRQELELLFTTLKDNERLHKLAENPLLLTVITALHRHERLPDRRIQVYDRCAELLLETWARIKGTNERWRDMKMVKEDQYACIAHLGFVLHDLAKEQNNNRSSNAASDVSDRFMRTEIERFIKGQKLITEVAEQRAEAKRFLDLVQYEAGLIVERGTGEAGEPLYGFVHRTFQEYFAAADVYERYQQKEDPKVISKFLREHLHDPHWQEVILLLLSKLKRGPVTAQLRQIFEGRLKSKRSKYNEIVQQDLFFVSTCLEEEISIENELAKKVVTHLSKLVKTSSFSSQRDAALQRFDRLMQTRQYANLAHDELVNLIKQNPILEPDTQLEVAQILFLHSSSGSKERQKALEVIFQSNHDINTTLIPSLIVAINIYKSCTKLDKHDKSLPLEPETEQLAQWISQMMQSTDQAIDILIHITYLYEINSKTTAVQSLLIKILTEWLQRPALPLDILITIASRLSSISIEDSPAQLLALKQLADVLQRPNLSLDTLINIASRLSISTNSETPVRLLALKKLADVLQCPDLSLDTLTVVAFILYRACSEDSDAYSLASSILTDILQSPDLPLDILIHIASSFHGFIFRTSNIQILVNKMLVKTLHRPNLPLEALIRIASSLYQIAHNYGATPHFTEEKNIALETLLKIIQNQELLTEQRLIAAAAFLELEHNQLSQKIQVTRLILLLLPAEQAQKYLKEYWPHYYSNSQAELADISIIAELAMNETLPDRIRDDMCRILRENVSRFDKLP